VKITKVNVAIHLTVPLPDYANMKPGVELEATLDDGEDFEAAHTALYAKAKRLLLAQCMDMQVMSTSLKRDPMTYIEAFMVEG
jgi:hypothetical protein